VCLADLFSEPVLQVVSSEDRFARAYTASGQHLKRIKLSLSDGRHVIPAMAASQIYDQARKLRRHDFIHLVAFTVTKYSFQKTSVGGADADAQPHEGAVILITALARVRGSPPLFYGGCQIGI
jgi:hypothetical protein